MTLGDKIFNFKSNSNIFVKLSLSTSYRLTRSMAYFINNDLKVKNKIKSIKNGSNVRFLQINIFD